MTTTATANELPPGVPANLDEGGPVITEAGSESLVAALKPLGETMLTPDEVEAIFGVSWKIQRNSIIDGQLQSFNGYADKGMVKYVPLKVAQWLERRFTGKYKLNPHAVKAACEQRESAAAVVAERKASERQLRDQVEEELKNREAADARERDEAVAEFVKIVSCASSPKDSDASTLLTLGEVLGWDDPLGVFEDAQKAVAKYGRLAALHGKKEELAKAATRAAESHRDLVRRHQNEMDAAGMAMRNAQAEYRQANLAATSARALAKTSPLLFTEGADGFPVLRGEALAN